MSTSAASLWQEKVELVTEHYIAAALWADAEEGTKPRCPAAEAAQAAKVCDEFMRRCNASQHGRLFDLAMARYEHGYGKHSDAGSAEAAFGHDFWLTRQGHGTGFWDRKELESEIAPGLSLGDALTAEAGKFGECHGAYQYGGWWYFNEKL